MRFPAKHIRCLFRAFLAALILFTLIASIPAVVVAQEEAALRLRLRRDFGYGSGPNIQGRFSLIVDGDEALERVLFYVDDEVIGEDAEEPFRLQFNTGGFELGWHTFYAIGYTTSGSELQSNHLQRQFVSGNTSTYIVIAVVVLVIGFRIISHLITRNKVPGKKQGYGIYGGAICPRCGRPFSRHWWAPNLVAGKLDRCPHCGKWHFSTRATPQMLESAEQFAEELDSETGAAVPETDEKELLRKRLDESRFDN